MDGLTTEEPALRHAGLNLTYATLEEAEQVESDVFGFWVFLMSDAVIFALLFAIFGTALRATDGGPDLHAVVKIGPAFIETMLLLTSSFTFAMASVALKQQRRRAPAARWLVVTLLLGLGFLAMEINDFATMFAHEAVPARSCFVSSYTALVATHGLHVFTGSLWLVVMLLQMGSIGLDRQVRINLVRLSLFWHFLDIVWIGIFSIVYLQGVLR